MYQNDTALCRIPRIIAAIRVRRRVPEHEKMLRHRLLRHRHHVDHQHVRPSVGIDMPGLCVHSLRATAATNALEYDADIAKVQEWLGHANVSTIRLYDRRRSSPEDSSTFRVEY